MGGKTKKRLKNAALSRFSKGTEEAGPEESEKQKGHQDKREQHSGERGRLTSISI